MNPITQAWAFLLLAPVVLCGCLNFFSPLDHPTSDAQLISAARACVDEGDLQCAFDLYSRVSSANSDTAVSEIAFSVLDRNGASMAAFMSAFGTGNINAGPAVTRLAAHLSGHADQTHRISIFGAYQQVSGIRDPALRGLVRFMTATALIAEILAEEATVPGQYTTADLVTAATCSATTNCASAVDCVGPATSKIRSGPNIADLDTATVAQLSGTPTFHMINAALNKIQYALTQEVVADAGLGAATAGFANQLLTSAGASPGTYLPSDSSSSIDSSCYRFGLLTNGISLPQ